MFHRLAVRPCRAFTLVELLVVVAIIALLLGILIPSLGRARQVAINTTCMANLNQLGKGVITYDYEEDAIPFGPVVANYSADFSEVPNGVNDDFMATNQLRATASVTASGEVEMMAMGLLMEQNSFSADALFCPGDDTTDDTEELAKLDDPDNEEHVFGSYAYRQTDETEGHSLANLGRNGHDIPVAALAFDLNSALTQQARSNHKGLRVNVVNVDNSVTHYDNEDGTLSLRDADMGYTDPITGAGFPKGRFDQLLRNFDAGYQTGRAESEAP